MYKISRRRLLALIGGGSAVAVGGASRPLGASPESARGISLQTRLTTEYGVQYPLVGAGMAFVALPELVAAISEAGGIGVLGAAPEPPPVVTARIRDIRSRTAELFGVDFIIGGEPPFGPFTTDAHIDACVAERVPLVVFHWSLPPAHWIARLRAAGTRVWAQVGSVEDARQAAALGVDAIIAQGSQAGGHVRSITRTIELVEEVVAAVRPTMVLAAGGIADGDAVVEALAAGAEGVWVGTRLVASTEAYAHPEYKERLVRATGRHATALTTLFGPEWPGQRQRVLRNRVVAEWAGRESEVPTPPPPPPVVGVTVLAPGVLNVPHAMPKFSAAIPTRDTVGDLEEMDMPAGEKSVKQIKSVMPAREIVVEMMEEARAIILQKLA